MGFFIFGDECLLQRSEQRQRASLLLRNNGCRVGRRYFKPVAYSHMVTDFSTTWF